MTEGTTNPLEELMEALKAAAGSGYARGIHQVLREHLARVGGLTRRTVATQTWQQVIPVPRRAKNCPPSEEVTIEGEGEASSSTCYLSAGDLPESDQRPALDDTMDNIEELPADFEEGQQPSEEPTALKESVEGGPTLVEGVGAMPAGVVPNQKDDYEPPEKGEEESSGVAEPAAAAEESLAKDKEPTSTSEGLPAGAVELAAVAEESHAKVGEPAPMREGLPAGAVEPVVAAEESRARANEPAATDMPEIEAKKVPAEIEMGPTRETEPAQEADESGTSLEGTLVGEEVTIVEEIDPLPEEGPKAQESAEEPPVMKEAPRRPTGAEIFEKEHRAGLERFFKRQAEEAEAQRKTARKPVPKRLPERRPKRNHQLPRGQPNLPREALPPSNSPNPVSIWEEGPIDRQNGCWRCGRSGHKHRYCSAPETTFCFRCGRIGYTVQTCPKCGQTWKAGGPHHPWGHK